LVRNGLRDGDAPSIMTEFDGGQVMLHRRNSFDPLLAGVLRGARVQFLR
jgi:hypothetical protein